MITTKKVLGLFVFSTGVTKLVVIALMTSLIAFVQAGQSQGRPAIEKVEPPIAVRGDVVTVGATDLPDGIREVRVQLNQFRLKDPVKLGPDGKSVQFRIPKENPDDSSKLFPLGKYGVDLILKFEDHSDWTITAGAESGKDLLRVVSDKTSELKVTAIHPKTAYPADDGYSLVVIGEGFSREPQDNELLEESQGMVKTLWTTPCNPLDGSACGTLVNTGQLEFSRIPRSKRKGQLLFCIRVGDKVSEPVAITFSRVSEFTPLIWSLVGLAVLAILVAWLARKSKVVHKVAERKYGVLHRMFLDPETDTYSLSKLQFYLWTAVAVFGYNYLTLARTLIQGSFEFPEIPENLPGIILVSASTTALAQGITGARGPKGAGVVYPSFADFFTTGGIFVAERFQFFVWTLVGVSAFVFLVLASDPSRIEELPKIPEGFLYLMGVSSAGYLGGKIVRKPGPIIDSITASLSSLTLEIHGRNLSEDAGLLIDGRDVATDKLEGPPVVEKDKSTGEAGMAKVLTFVIKETGIRTEWREGKHELTLINPDGQQAVWEFEIGGDN